MSLVNPLRICPKCHRISIEYDYFRQLDRCLFYDCCWTEMDGGEPKTEYSEDFLPWYKQQKITPDWYIK